jgi:hypothetical protein
MEDLWKKFKEETKEHMEKINEFLKERSLNNENISNETKVEAKPEVKLNNEISQQIVLEDETSKNEISHVSRKDSYGKLKNLVKEIMEKEHVSRAQAYRRAKKRLDS